MRLARSIMPFTAPKHALATSYTAAFELTPTACAQRHAVAGSKSSRHTALYTSAPTSSGRTADDARTFRAARDGAVRYAEPRAATTAARRYS